MHYRNIAWYTGIQFAFDLTRLPAIVEDELIGAINDNDKRVVIQRGNDDDPFKH